MKAFRVTVAGALVLFVVTAGFGMSVKSDYEKNFDFSQLHTFAFRLTGPVMTRSVQIHSRPVVSRAH